MILRILEEVRPQKLVLAHMGGWKNWKAVGTYIAGADVWLDTAFAMGRIDTDHSPSEGSQWLPQPGCVSENDPEQDDYYNMTADSFGIYAVSRHFSPVQLSSPCHHIQ